MLSSGLLIVEDDPDDLEALVKAVKRYGVGGEVRVAGDGAAALDELARPALPRLVLLDLNLPKIAGLEVLRAIRADRRLKRLPVVIMSASTGEREVDQAYALGVSSCIAKPQTYAEYDRVVGDLLHYWLEVNLPATAAPSLKIPGWAKAKREGRWPRA